LEVQRFRGTEVQRFGGTEVLRYRGFAPSEKDFEKGESKISPILWRGAGGEVFLLKSTYKPHPKSFST
jgi:hypothetical protein